MKIIPQKWIDKFKENWNQRGVSYVVLTDWKWVWGCKCGHIERKVDATVPFQCPSCLATTGTFRVVQARLERLPGGETIWVMNHGYIKDYDGNTAQSLKHKEVKQ